MKYCLIVDDSSVIRKVARRIFEGFGFHVEEAEDGQRAVDLCRGGMPDAILLDWRMPVMDGIDVLRHVRAMPGGDLPKVVYCMPENDVNRITRALRSGADDILLKPFDRGLVEAKLVDLGLI